MEHTEKEVTGYVASKISVSLKISPQKRRNANGRSKNISTRKKVEPFQRDRVKGVNIRRSN